MRVAVQKSYQNEEKQAFGAFLKAKRTLGKAFVNRGMLTTS